VLYPELVTLVHSDILTLDLLLTQALFACW